MQPIQAVEQPISTLFEPIVGKIRIKTYFSYYGIFANGYMLALFKDNTIYLRASKHTKESLKKVEGTYLLQDSTAGIHTKNFYALSYDFAYHSPLFPIWVKDILNELITQYIQEQEKLKTQIRSLPNMNIKFERILRKINIVNVEQFQQKGDINTFVELIKQGSDGSDLLLYKLYGALNKKSIYHISPEEKRSLLKEANLALYEAGLRHRFDVI